MALTASVPSSETVEIDVVVEHDGEHNHSRWRYTAIIVAALMINFTACGLLFGFGIYQAVYERMALEEGTPFTGATSAEIDLIGTLSISLMTIGAPFAVAWAKHFPPQLIVMTGGVLFGVSNILASFGKTIWHFQLAQGLSLGIGTCLCFMPSMTVAPTWFGQHRALAMGMVSAGTGIGGLVWAPAITACITRIGFRDTLRLTGALSIVLLCAAGSVLSWEPSMYPHLHEDRSVSRGIKRFFQVPLPTWRTIRQRRFVAQALSSCFQSAAYYTPTFFIVSYAKTLGYDDRTGANLTAVSNACNAIGKVAMGLLADKIGRVNSFLLTTLVSACAALGLWISSTTIGQTDIVTARSLFITFTVLFGTFASAFISLFSPVLVELFGIHELPRISGIMYMIQGIAAMVGMPMAGYIIQDNARDDDPRGYTNMAVLVGVLMFAATMSVAWVRFEIVQDVDDGREKRRSLLQDMFVGKKKEHMV